MGTPEILQDRCVCVYVCVFHLSCVAQTMSDHELVLKCWGAVEADYTGHGGEVLTR